MVSLDRSGGSDDNEDIGTLVDLLVSTEADPLAGVESAERGRQIRQAVDQLPLHMRTVVNLVYYQGMKYREAAEVMSVPVGTVKSRLHAAILKLSQLWTNTHTQQK